MTRRTAAETIDAVWRIESARLIAGLARIVGDVGLAEDLAQDALVAALEQWPEAGVPDNPGAWLMATAKHRAIDQLRRQKMQGRKHEHLGRELDERQVSPESALAAAIDDHVGDDSAADRPRQAHARGGARALRGPARRRAGAAARVGARGHLSHLQRGILGDGWRRVGAAGAVRGCAPSGPYSRRAGARGGRSAWARRAHGDPGIAHPR